MSDGGRRTSRLSSRACGAASVEAYDLLFERHDASCPSRRQAALDDADRGRRRRGRGVRLGARRPAARERTPEAFVGYLVSSVRHEAYRANRRRADRPVGDRPTSPPTDPFAGREDADILRAAFGSLPASSRDVLWRTEVEGRSHADIASTRRLDGAGDRRQRVAGPGRARRRLPRRTPRPGLRRSLRARRSARTSGRNSSSSSAAPRAAAGGGRWRRTSPSALACREGRDRLDRFNERLRTAPPLVPVARRIGAPWSPGSHPSPRRSRRRHHARRCGRGGPVAPETPTVGSP